MPGKNTTPAATPLALPRYTPSENRLAYAVTRSPRLRGLLPADEVTPLVEAYHRAEKLVAEARALRVEAADPTADLHAAVQNAEDVDVPALIAKITEARASQAAHEETMRVLSALPEKYKQEIVHAIEDAEETLLEGLGEQLNATLDDAEEVLRRLDGRTDAESALLADRGAEYRRWCELADVYSDVRTAQRQLILASPSAGSSTTSPDLVAAMFRNAAPFTRQPSGAGMPSGGVWQAPKAEVDLTDIASRSHFAWVVAHRAEVQPRVGRGDSAVSIPLDAGVQFAPRRLSARDEYTLHRARNAAADRIAEERAAFL